jgi:hypothetical protein
MLGFFFIAAGGLVIYYVFVKNPWHPFNWDALGGAAFILGFSALLFLIGGWSMKASQKDMNDRIEFEVASTTTTARTIDRGRKQRKDSYGKKYYTYWVSVQFQTTKAETKTRDHLLRVDVSKKQYDAFEPGQSLKVRYANSNPHVALMEWETSSIERTPNIVDIMLRWILANVIGGVVGFYVSNALGIDDLLLSGAIAGLIIAEAQWIVLFRYFPIPNWKWVIACIIGWAVFVRLNAFAYGFVGGTILGVVQWFILRKKLAKAEWWVVFTAMGMSLGQIVFNLMIPNSTDTAAGISFDFIYGAITGIGMYIIASQSFEQGLPDSALEFIQEPMLPQLKPQAPDSLRVESEAEAIKLTLSGKLISDLPDENIIRQTLESLDIQGGDFAILSRTEMTFIQARYGDGENFIMEYQDGSLTEHYDCISADLDLTKVVEAFTMFLNANERLMTEFSWELMDL